MRRYLRLFLVATTALVFSVLLGGCYTQVGSVRSGDKFSEEYAREEVVEEVESVDSTGYDRNYYFDEYGYPRDRFYFGYYSPSTIHIGVWHDPWGWHNPYSYRSWFWAYDPFWCWNYSPLAYAGWYYPPTYWYPPIYGSPGYRYRDYAGGHGTTRTVGTTRGLTGSTRGRDSEGYRDTRRVDTDLPTGMRSNTSGTRDQNPQATPSARTSTGRKGTDASGRSAVRSGTSRGGSTREGARTGERRTPRRPVEQAPPQDNSGSRGSENRGGERRSGGGQSHTPSSPPAQSPPQSTPPGNSGGSSRGGNSRGGGGGR